MEKIDKLNQESVEIQGLLGQYLKHRASGATSQVSGQHLDQDSLSAFVEGNLSDREAAPMVTHLIDCSFCRHVTTELVRLDLAFADEEPVRPIIEENVPASISSVLGSILSRIFGSGDAAVFAHNEADDKDKEDKEETEDNK